MGFNHCINNLMITSDVWFAEETSIEFSLQSQLEKWVDWNQDLRNQKKKYISLYMCTYIDVRVCVFLHLSLAQATSACAKTSSACVRMIAKLQLTSRPAVPRLSLHQTDSKYAQAAAEPWKAAAKTGGCGISEPAQTQMGHFHDSELCHGLTARPLFMLFGKKEPDSLPVTDGLSATKCCV